MTAPQTSLRPGGATPAGGARLRPRYLRTFYLGTHMPNWLQTASVPLFVSHRRLAGRRTYPRAGVHWALDSGGFSELSLYGEWRTTPEEYVRAITRYDTEIGRLQWAAPQDWMCEPIMVAKTGLSVVEHQRRTIANFACLSELWRDTNDEDSPFVPVVQGWDLADYLRCWDMYGEAGIDLREYELVGLGSVCRRQAEDEIGDIISALLDLDPDLPLHGFGVKKQGLAKYGHLLSSADSMAWSYDARRRPALPSCSHGKDGRGNCANCLIYATRWYEQVAS